jgi:ABC-type transport system involved in Fe-S cluster assembly fused permease/ATPase subunit
VRQASLRAALGIVPQDTVLFNDTVGYNIGYGKEGATQAISRKRRAARRSTISSPAFRTATTRRSGSAA